jgi:hypothetical protein
MQEQVVTDEARCFGASVAIVDTNERSSRPGLHLALILQQSIGLDNGDREIPQGVFANVFVPQKAIVIVIRPIPLLPAHAAILLDWAPARRYQFYQPRKHPSASSGLVIHQRTLSSIAEFIIHHATISRYPIYHPRPNFHP